MSDQDITIDEKFVINTNPALQALYNEIGGSYREVAGVFGVSHSHLWHALKGDRDPVSVNTLVKYAKRTRESAGISMTLVIKPDASLLYKIERE